MPKVVGTVKTHFDFPRAARLSHSREAMSERRSPLNQFNLARGMRFAQPLPGSFPLMPS